MLVDTGLASGRGVLTAALESAGCTPGKLKLIVLTHGDLDHAGNCAFLREVYGVKIAMHEGDSGMVENADMSWNRKPKFDRISAMGRFIIFVGALVSMSGKSKFETFRPDMYLEGGQSLEGYGINAKILHLPGHSAGSIGVLTENGSLICGDLIYNFFKPKFALIDDMASAKESLQKISGPEVKLVYPGHGKPFLMDNFEA